MTWGQLHVTRNVASSDLPHCDMSVKGSKREMWFEPDCINQSFNIYTLKYLWITYVNPHVYFILRFCLIQNRIWNVTKFKVLIYYDLFSYYSWIIYNFIVEGFILFKKNYFPWAINIFYGGKGGCCSTTNPWVPKLHLPKICLSKSKESFFSPKIFFIYCMEYGIRVFLCKII